MSDPGNCIARVTLNNQRPIERFRENPQYKFSCWKKKYKTKQNKTKKSSKVMENPPKLMLVIWTSNSQKKKR